MQKVLKVIANKFGHLLWTVKVQLSVKFEQERLLSIIITKAHGIEKGLSIRDDIIRLGFGYPSISSMLAQIRKYQSKGYNMDATGILMASGAVAAYLAFHKNRNFSNDNINHIAAEYEWLKKHLPENSAALGGTIEVEKSDMNFDFDVIRNFFMTRHSVRDFSSENISDEHLREAVNLAMRAPSACNRQASRVYIVDKSKCEIFKDYLKNVGGFQEDINKIMVVTGKASSYRRGERYQYIVSASMFAGYLTLALHAMGIGCCIIQSPVVYYRQTAKVAKAIGIPEDEQIICMGGLGMLKSSFRVPMSTRFKLEEVMRLVH